MLRKLICRLFGHRWRYKLYDLLLRLDDDKKDYTKIRKCRTCKTKEVFTKNKEWVKKELTPAKR